LSFASFKSHSFSAISSSVGGTGSFRVVLLFGEAGYYKTGTSGSSFGSSGIASFFIFSSYSSLLLSQSHM
jgi:hypothetical protein